MNEVFNEWRTDVATRNVWWQPWNDQHQQQQPYGGQRAPSAANSADEEPNNKRTKTESRTATE